MRSGERAPHLWVLWVHRALLMVAVALTLGPLVVAGVGVYSRPHWEFSEFEFFCMSWVVEMMAALGGAQLVRRLKDARKQEVTRTLRAELFVARLAFWSSLLLSLALFCAIAWLANRGTESFSIPRAFGFRGGDTTRGQLPLRLAALGYDVDRVPDEQLGGRSD